MKIEFIESDFLDQTGTVIKVYRAVFLTAQGNEGENVRDVNGTQRELSRLTVTRRAILNLEGLQDIELAQVVASEILAKMRDSQWPQGASPEALLYAVVNEALHVLKKTAADFLLTEDSPADTLTT